MATYDGYTQKIYVNGELSGAQKKGNQYYPNNDIDILIGSAFIKSKVAYNFFNGTIDEILIYNRALTNDEIKKINES